MDEAMTVIDGGINTTGGAYFYQGQSFEELKQLLACASMELKSQREAAKAQEQLHDARVRHLEELLKTARRERDEYRDQFVQLKGRVLSSRSMGSGMTQEPQLRTRSGLQPLESVASMSEPSRATLTEMHRKLQLEYVSSMTEPTRDTLTEVHRKMQEQQQQQQHLELHQQLDIHQLQQHHHLDLHHQHSNNISQQLDLRPSPAASHLEFQSQHQQHQHLEELRQHFEIQQKDHLPGQSLHMDIVMNERQSDVSHSGELDNGSDAKSTTWNEFPSGVHLDIHDPPDLILESSEPIHMNKLTQGMPSQGLPTQGLPPPHVDQRSSPSSHLDDLQQQLQHHHQQQQQQDDSMPMHLHHQQHESEEILSHMQQGGQSADTHGLHLPEEKKLRRQLSKRQDGGLPSISVGLQGGANDGVMNMAVLQQQQQHSSPWPAGLMSLGSSAPISNGQNGISEQLLQTSCLQGLQGGSVVASILSPLERYTGDSTCTSMLHPRPVHLPEPPEADPQVMLNSLPEKGKLLQAVIQAGPLLQSLLLAGPLPQWRHPPPPMDAEEIPRVNMNATVGVSMGATGGVSMGATGGVSMGASVGIMPSGGEQGIRLMSSHGSLEQVMRLSTPLQSSPSQNGFCH